jgi:hypothetical protein
MQAVDELNLGVFPIVEGELAGACTDRDEGVGRIAGSNRNEMLRAFGNSVVRHFHQCPPGDEVARL